MMWVERREAPRGTVLIVAVLLLALLTTLGVALMGSSLSENVVSHNDVNSQGALAVAEAGIAHARAKLAVNVTSDTLTTALGAATAVDGWVPLTDFADVESFGTGNGKYSGWIQNNTTAYTKQPGYPADSEGATTDTDRRIWIKSVGRYRNATRTVRALVYFPDFSVLNPPGAITLIDGGAATTATFNGTSFAVTGTDTVAPSTAPSACGSPSSTNDRSGVSLNSADSNSTIGTAVAHNQEPLVTGTGMVSTTTTTEIGRSGRFETTTTVTQGSYANNGTISADTLMNMAFGLVPAAQDIGTGTYTGALGSADAPGIFVSKGDLRLSGGAGGANRGYGVLVVLGDFDLSGSYIWEGLILVVGNGNAMLTGTGGSGDEGKVFGALLALNTKGGATSLTAGGNGGAKYSSQAICRLTNKESVPPGVVVAWQQVD